MIQPKKNPNGSFLWSQADKEKLRDLYHEGYTDEEIAIQLGRTRKAVGAMRCALKLKLKSQPEKKFVIKDSMADYYPPWYLKKLKKEWDQQFSK